MKTKFLPSRQFMAKADAVRSEERGLFICVFDIRNSVGLSRCSFLFEQLFLCDSYDYIL